MEDQYFLYRHIRADKNEPFYIGIGQKHNAKSFESIYHRAYSAKSRNKIWESIVSRTDYTVDVLFSSSDKKFIQNKEVEFIELYGRIDKNKGSLANLTDGGEFNKNVSHIVWEKRKQTLINSGEYKKMIDRMSIFKRQKGQSGAEALTRKVVANGV